MSNNIHPSAIIYPGVQMGDNNVIGPLCIIGAPPEFRGKEHISGKVIIGNNNTITGAITIDSGAEGNTIVGNDCYIMKGAHLGHDSVICDGVTISCGAKIGGHAMLGKGVNCGLNSVVHQKQVIAEGCMIGMGAVIPKKLKTQPYKIYAGVPAKEIGDNVRHPEYTANMNEWPDA